jgi:hypothetical protein
VSILAIKSADDCRYDLVALGEVMLRFDPGDGEEPAEQNEIAEPHRRREDT